MTLILGIVIGLLIALIVLVLTRKYEVVIQQVLTSKPFAPQKGDAYIAGLSDEEQNFSDTLKESTDDYKLT